MKNINCDGELFLGKNVQIGENVEVNCTEKFYLGDNSIIGDNVKINCTSFTADEYFYMMDGCEVGRGGSKGPNSKVEIGKNVGIFERTIINPSDKVTIGDNTGIGGEVMIWTHGAWLDITQGFPADFGPVHIGKNVWLPARSVVLPNVSIGNNVVIGINSIINRSLPDGCFAAGSPCKVIKEKVYPQELSDEQLKNIANDIISDWLTLIQYKTNRVYDVYYSDKKIILNSNNETTIYDIVDKTMDGGSNSISEDLRDYLRRRGIKIYTGRLFKSI